MKDAYTGVYRLVRRNILVSDLVFEGRKADLVSAEAQNGHEFNIRYTGRTTVWRSIIGASIGSREIIPNIRPR